MKYRTSIIAIVLSLVSVGAVLTCHHQASSQSSPPPQAPTFNAHYSEANFTLPPEGTTPFFTLPRFDRAVRLVVTYIGDGSENDFGFAEHTFLYRTLNNTLNSEFVQILPEHFPDGYSISPLFNVLPGDNGTIAIRTFFTAPGTLHVAMWH